MDHLAKGSVKMTTHCCACKSLALFFLKQTDLVFRRDYFEPSLTCNSSKNSAICYYASSYLIAVVENPLVAHWKDLYFQMSVKHLTLHSLSKQDRGVPCLNCLSIFK